MREEKQSEENLVQTLRIEGPQKLESALGQRCMVVVPHESHSFSKGQRALFG